MTKASGGCPTCKGATRVSVTISTLGEEGSDTAELDCHTCDGKGAVSQARAEAIAAHLADWCSCGNPSGDTDSYADGEHPKCHKHHYRCADCKKIVQIG